MQKSSVMERVSQSVSERVTKQSIEKLPLQKYPEVFKLTKVMNDKQDIWYRAENFVVFICGIAF